MRIACIDKSAADRLKLERFLDDAFRECRRSIGHMNVARFFPSSKEEILVNSAPDAAIIGSVFGADAALLLARDISSVHPNLPVFVFLDPEEYTVRNIKRFEPYIREVFSISDVPSRFVYSLTSVTSREQAGQRGVLFAVQGVKGGVGVTSTVGAIAHAAQALGKNAVLVDLSQRGELSQFFLCDRWHSSEYATLITDKVIPEAEHLNKIIVTAKNGLPILPPPSGSGEMRELWLRDSTRFEVPLAMIDLLQERYDVVIVDFAGAEGILPFAIECRADVRLFISANEPGSVHMLTSRVDEFDMPNEGVTRFLINKTNPQGLTHEDILDFIAWSPKFSEEMLYSEEIPYDAKAGLWIGTGNSLYTEGNNKLKEAIESLTRDALGMDESKKKSIKIPFSNAIKAIASRVGQKEISFDRKERLPLLRGAANAHSLDDLPNKLSKAGKNAFDKKNNNKDALGRKRIEHKVEASQHLKNSAKNGFVLSSGSDDTENNIRNESFEWTNKDSDNFQLDSKEKKDELIYEPPRLRANDS